MAPKGAENLKNRSENMIFKSPEPEDYLLYKRFLSDGDMSCENSFLNAYIWKEQYNYQYSFFNKDTLVTRIFDGNNYLYFLPIGSGFFEAVDAIIDEQKENVIFYSGEGSRLDRFLDKYGDKFDLKPVEDNFEYIYNSSDLALLSGKKYHQKRNHISAFSRNYTWRFEQFSDENIADIVVVTEKWAQERGNIYAGELACEINAIRNIVNFYKKLEVTGGILYVDDIPVAFTFGTELNGDTFDVTTEKALYKYPGAYAVINNEFAKCCLYPKYKYINREDDLGIEGLRKAKLSYHPEIILKKYIISPKSKNL